ncbi:MAG: amidase [Nitratireductor sp.]|nr:amidase [Nitratireductor sp.]
MPKTRYTGPELCALSAREAVKLLKRKEVSPAEMLDAAFERIAQVEPSVNAVVATCEDRARKAVQRLAVDERINGREPGWLAGLPIAIKDLTMVSGVRTTYGNMALKDFVPEQTDPLVELMERRGAVVVGKTNTPEFGAGGNTFNDVYGYTRNPWDTRKNAGGSSGGAAVSLATGEVWLSQGSDLAGSARTPAGFCGIVGMRPSPGRCGGGPAATAFATEGISGPMARDVQDLALFLDTMAGFIPEMPITLEAPATPFQEAVKRADGKVRIAFSEDQGGFAPVEREIRSVLRGAMQKIAGSGGEVEDACPQLPGLYETYVTLRGIHYGSVNAYLPDAVQAHFKRTLRENTQFGRSLKTPDIFDALRQRTVLYHAMRTFLEGHDVLAIPVAGIEPGLVEEEYPMMVDGEPVTDYVDWLRFSFLATATGLPALVVPVGFTASGMPVGVQLVGRPRGEARLLAVARAVEVAIGFPSTPIDPVNPA